MPMTKDEHEALQKAGANSRALGQSEIANPFLDPRNMPRATGDSVEDWQAKHDAWALGWKAEDLMRGDS